MREIRVGMRLLYDGEPCVVKALRRISTGEQIEAAGSEEFHDVVAVLGGEGWEARLRLTEEALQRLSEFVEEEALAGGEAASDLVEERMPIDWESITGGEPIEMEEEEVVPSQEREEGEVEVEELPGEMEVEFEE